MSIATIKKTLISLIMSPESKMELILMNTLNLVNVMMNMHILLVITINANACMDIDTLKYKINA